ncbi:MAG: hypothetical protein GWN58_23000 [Anaerolineae bacterium]|nr:hypothetical protein [Anaerolineae bacterium]
MSRVKDLKLIHACRLAGQTPPDGLLVWEPETEAFDSLCKRLARASTFEGVESKRGNWFVKFALGKNRYRWQMPDEETARRVERYAANGGGFAYARRRAVRSYRWDEAKGGWSTLNIKNSKKWRSQAAERSRVKRKKRAKQKAKRRALDRHDQWSREFDEKSKAYAQEEKP